MMQINHIEKFTKQYGRIDAILIVNRDDIIEYSAMVTEGQEYLRTDDILGKNLFQVYPDLTRENSTHAKVMETGQPVLDYKQTLTEPSGRRHTSITSTFPIENNGEIIGSLDLSVDLSSPDSGDAKGPGRLYTLEDVITADAHMGALKEKIAKISRGDSPVMIIGESGTGKELLVEALHAEGPRCRKPFISLNCAAVPDALIESTLFGTVKGSFTGAENRKGLFELADGGTLFLDELNSMEPALQTKLLKAIEEQRYMKVGAETYTKVDVRLISAMNVPPQEAVAEGKLRLDLFYRLGVVQLTVPPLRKRPDDIPVLIKHFLELYNRKMGKAVAGLNPLAESVLQGYGWPGNVRELKNVIESAFNVVEGNQIRISDLPDYLISGSHISDLSGERAAGGVAEDGFADSRPAEERTINEGLADGGLAEMMNRYERKILEEVLGESVSLNAAAAKLKITRQALKYKIEKLGIDYQSLLQ